MEMIKSISLYYHDACSGSPCGIFGLGGDYRIERGMEKGLGEEKAGSRDDNLLLLVQKSTMNCNSILYYLAMIHVFMKHKFHGFTSQARFKTIDCN